VSLICRIANACAASALALAVTWHPAEADVMAQYPLGVTAPNPLTYEEQAAFRMAVQRCWNVGGLSAEALRVTVVVHLTLDQYGKPDPTSLVLADFEGGSAAAARQAFEAAKHAILRCSRDGYDLPAEKYDVWKDVSIVFDLRGMRMS
jgi:hypothetical protein